MWPEGKTALPPAWGDLNVAHLQRIEAFVAAARLVASAPDGRSGNPALSFLCAHAMELALKAILYREARGLQDKKLKSHDLSALLERCKETSPAAIKVAALALRPRLAALAEETIAKCLLPGDPDHDEPAAAMRRAAEAVTLEEVVDWLSDRHATNGGTFRYVRLGLENIPVLPNTQVEPVPEAAPTAAAAVVNHLHAALRADALAFRDPAKRRPDSTGPN